MIMTALTQRHRSQEFWYGKPFMYNIYKGHMPMVYTAVFLLGLHYHLQYKITEVYMTDLKASLAKGHRRGFLHSIT